MFDDPPMPAETLWTLYGLSELAGWQQRWRVIGWIASFPEGTWCDGPELASIFGTQRDRESMRLLELTRAKVLERDGTRRRFWYRVNPRWREWQIPWRHDHRTIEQILAWRAQRADQSPLERLFSRSYGARTRLVSRGLMAREQPNGTGSEAPSSRGSMAREQRQNGLSGQGGSRGIEPREQQNGSRAKDRENSNEPGRGNTPSSRGIEPRPKRGPVQEEEIDTPDAQDPPPQSRPPAPDEVELGGIVIGASDWAQARRAVLRRAIGRNGEKPWIQGRYERALALLVSRYDADQVEAAADKIEAGTYLVPRFVTLLSDVLDVGPAADGPWLGQQRLHDDEASINARLAGVEELIATREAFLDQEATPVPAGKAAELASRAASNTKRPAPAGASKDETLEELYRERDDLRRQLDEIGHDAKVT